MNNLTNESIPEAYPTAVWTWYDGKGGLLSTQIFSGGQIRQQRQHDQGDSVTPQDLGVIPPAQAAALLMRWRETLGTGASNVAPSAPYGETYEFVLAESDTQQSSRQIARAALKSDAALQTIRREVLGVRRQVDRRWNIWTSAGARWFFLTLAVTLALGLYIAHDIRHDGQLQARAQQTTGTVLERGGVPYKSEYLTVKLESLPAAPEVKIADYLSHPHWEASPPGSKVHVEYDAQSGQAWLTEDLQRWQHDKKTIWVLPAFLLLAALAGLAWLRRYQIGVYGTGEEYMIREDRVVTDDKDSLIPRWLLLWIKMFI